MQINAFLMYLLYMNSQYFNALLYLQEQVCVHLNPS